MQNWISAPADQPRTGGFDIPVGCVASFNAPSHLPGVVRQKARRTLQAVVADFGCRNLAGESRCRRLLCRLDSGFRRNDGFGLLAPSALEIFRGNAYSTESGSRRSLEKSVRTAGPNEAGLEN